MTSRDDETTGGAVPVDPVLENVRLACRCGADPAMILTVALAAAGPRTLPEAFRLLEEKREAIEQIARDPGDLTELAVLEPELRYDPELARVRPDLADHELRGKLVFKDLVTKWSFFKVVGFAIGGVVLSESDAQLLADAGVLGQLADPEIWPCAATRRAAAGGSGLACSIITGIACYCTQKMAGLAVSGFMQFLDIVEEQLAAGLTLDTIVHDVIARRERVLGLGRPALGPDERIPQLMKLQEQCGRADGPSVRLTKQLDTRFMAAKGLRMNSAAYLGALLRDLGFSPAAAAAITTLYFFVPVLAHSVYAEERSVAARQRDTQGKSSTSSRPSDH